MPLAFVCSPAIARLLTSETATLFREILHGARHLGAGVPLSGGAPQPPGCINLLGDFTKRPAFPRPAVFDDAANHVRPKVIGLYMVLIAANLLAWARAFAAFHGYPFLLATALIAYGFGLRHAVDADHIAAIDNVTRKLMQEDKRPIAVGFFFSLGNSTVVIAAAILIALTASSVQRSFPGLIASARCSVGCSEPCSD